MRYKRRCVVLEFESIERCTFLTFWLALIGSIFQRTPDLVSRCSSIVLFYLEAAFCRKGILSGGNRSGNVMSAGHFGPFP